MATALLTPRRYAPGLNAPHRPAERPLKVAKPAGHSGAGAVAGHWVARPGGPDGLSPLPVARSAHPPPVSLRPRPPAPGGAILPVPRPAGRGSGSAGASDWGRGAGRAGGPSERSPAVAHAAQEAQPVRAS